MNKIVLLGRLTRDAEVRYSQGEKTTAVANFSLAVPRKFKKEGEPDCDFFNCRAFGKQAEFAEKYLKQGTKILLSGRVQNNNYTNKDGQKVYSVQILVEEVEFAESKSSQSNQNTQDGPPPAQNNIGDGFMNIPTGIEEELPFN